MQPDSQVHVHWKGAAEVLLAACAKYVDANDQVVTLDDDKVWEILTFLCFQKLYDTIINSTFFWEILTCFMFPKAFWCYH